VPPQKPERAGWLIGPAASCWPPQADSQKASPQAGDLPHAYHLVLLGAPGVGKGTQAALLCQRLRACHLSTGDIFRAAKNIDPSRLSPGMAQALQAMRRGELVADATVLQIVKERTDCLRCRGGFVLDGFPRTLEQARALQEILVEQNVKLDATINYEMPLPQIIARLSGRRTCAACKAVFHVQNHPPKVPDICDRCGGALVQREDDKPEAVGVRMDAYQGSTAPLIEFYGKLGLLLRIDATGSPEEILRRTLKQLKNRSAATRSASGAAE